MTFAGALREGRSTFAQRLRKEHTLRESAEPAVPRFGEIGLPPVGVGLVWFSSRRLGPFLLRASGIRHSVVSGWPLFEGGTKDAEDDARR